MNRSLAEIRIASGYESQNSFALAANCTRSSVAKWEIGLRYPPSKILPALSKVLGVSIDEVIQAVAISAKRNQLTE